MKGRERDVREEIREEKREYIERKEPRFLGTRVSRYVRNSNDSIKTTNC